MSSPTVASAVGAAVSRNGSNGACAKSGTGAGSGSGSGSGSGTAGACAATSPATGAGVGAGSGAAQVAKRGAPVSQEGDMVLLVSNDGTRMFLQVIRGRMGKYRREKFSVNPLIGAEYGSWFELRDKKLTLVPETQGAADFSFELDATEALGDNRHLTTDVNAQTMSQDEIAALKVSGASGAEIIRELVKNSATFANKTAFSKAKYLKKKVKKYMRRLKLVKTTTANICETMFATKPEKICNLRLDSLGQLLTRANVHAGCKVLVSETCGGLVTGAIAQQLGGYGRVVQVFGSTNPNQHVIKIMNLSESVASAIENVPVKLVNEISADLEAGKETVDAPPREFVARSAGASDERKDGDRRPKRRDGDKPVVDRSHYSYQYHPRTYTGGKAAMGSWLREGVDSLVIVTNKDIQRTLMGLLPFVRPSRPVVIFSSFMQPLIECQKLLLKHKLVTKLEVFETWTRNYQVLPNRTHPTMQMHGASGFILWAYTVTSHFTKRLVDPTRTSEGAGEATSTADRKRGSPDGDEDESMGQDAEEDAAAVPPASKRGRADTGDAGSR